MDNKNKRNNKWLCEKLIKVWRQYFPDLSPRNKIFVRFGQPARRQLGKIKYGRKDQENPNTYIVINGLFRQLIIPDFVIDAVLAHELVHYLHGFRSPYQQQFSHPHRGGVVDRELTQRGLSDIIKMQKQWLKTNWLEVIKKYDY